MSTQNTKVSGEKSKAEKTIPKLPATEICWVRQTSESSKNYLIASNKDRTTYILYLSTSTGLKKLGKAKSPVMLESMIT